MRFFKRKNKQPLNIDWLIAGLGNPGKKYSQNRHNIGWIVATALCRKYKKSFNSDSDLYNNAIIEIYSKNVLVALPLTYMNSSGEAISYICEKYKIPFDKVLVIVDEYNFPLGKIQLKSGGGDGGHNGIASIIGHLSSNEFFRLRCGIGKNFSSGGMSDYVLSDFEENEISGRDNMINKAVESIEALVRLELARAMSLVNSGAVWEKENKDEK